MILGLPDPPPQTLSDWLRTATRGLTDASKARIRPEIEAHYAQAVEAHREHGLSESEAQMAALVELGDAGAAGKRFRKQYLTIWDAERLRKLHKGPRSIWYPLGCYFLFWFVTSDLFQFRRDWLATCNSLSLFLAFASLAFVALPTACFLVVRYAGANPNRPALFILSALTEVAAYAFFYVGCIVANPAFRKVSLIVNCFITILFLGFLTFRLLIFLRLWNKLSRERATNPGPAS